MCVTHNNIARGDSLIAFASLTISAKSIKIRLSHNLSNLFCENCAFLSNGSGSKAILEREVNSLIFWKKLFCFWVFYYFFQFFFLYIHLAVVLFFLCSHILGKGMVFFSKRRLFIFCVFCYVFQRNYSAFFEI